MRARRARDVAAVGRDQDAVEPRARREHADHAVEQRARDRGARPAAAAEPRLAGAKRARGHQRPRAGHAITSANDSTSAASRARSARSRMIVDEGRAGTLTGGASPRSITIPRSSAP